MVSPLHMLSFLSISISFQFQTVVALNFYSEQAESSRVLENGVPESVCWNEEAHEESLCGISMRLTSFTYSSNLGLVPGHDSLCFLYQASNLGSNFSFVQ